MRLVLLNYFPWNDFNLSAGLFEYAAVGEENCMKSIHVKALSHGTVEIGTVTKPNCQLNVKNFLLCKNVS